MGKSSVVSPRLIRDAGTISLQTLSYSGRYSVGLDTIHVSNILTTTNYPDSLGLKYQSTTDEIHRSRRSAQRTSGFTQRPFHQTTRTSFLVLQRRVSRPGLVARRSFERQSTGDRPKSSYQKVLEAGEVDPPPLCFVAREDGGNEEKRINKQSPCARCPCRF